MQAHSLRALIPCIDGIDEGADLKEVIETYLVEKLAPMGTRTVLTSRPEGVRLSMYQEEFVIMNLKPLTMEQQNSLISLQIGDNEFFKQLSATVNIQRTHDAIYTATAFPSPADRKEIEEMQVRSVVHA